MGTIVVVAIRRVVDTSTSGQMRTARENPGPFEYCDHQWFRSSTDQLPHSRRDELTTSDHQDCRSYIPTLLCARVQAADDHLARSAEQSVWSGRQARHHGRGLAYQETTQTKRPEHRNKCRGCSLLPIRPYRSCSPTSTAETCQTSLPCLVDRRQSTPWNPQAIQSHQ